MLPSEVLAKVRHIEIRTGKLVSETFGGQYHSVFKGRGMEFSEVREYEPGDDVRSIDWNVTARMGRPFIKQFVEERELTLLIACDLSDSQAFGTLDKLKKEIAAELAAVLAFSALQNKDKVGLFLFTDRVEKIVPPKKGRQHVLRLIRDLLAFEPAHKRTDIGNSLDTINRVVRKKSILLLISDFIDDRFDKVFRRTAKKHDLIPIWIQDPRETRLPRLPALLQLEDSETGERFLLDGRSALMRERYHKWKTQEQDRLERLFKTSGADFIRIDTHHSYIDPIVKFFRQRERRFRQ